MFISKASTSCANTCAIGCPHDMMGDEGLQATVDQAPTDKEVEEDAGPLKKSGV